MQRLSVAAGPHSDGRGEISSQAGSNCETYWTANEQVQACRNDSADISFTAGETMGTVGGVTAGAMDFGLYQTCHQNFFVNPSRYSSLTLTAVCPYDPFTSDLRAQINSRLGDFGQLASGESPMCGSMSGDVAGTARGAWVLQSAPVTQSGDETNFAALEPHPLYPQSADVFAGPGVALRVVWVVSESLSGCDVRRSQSPVQGRGR